MQARFNSSRLPGKVLRDIAGKPMLARVLGRLALATRIDDVALATSVGADDDAVAELGAQLGVRVVRGSETDVLSRYALAVHETRADVVVRVTADCPLLDAALVDDVVTAFGDAPFASDFAANTLERTYPRGLDVECTHREALLIAHAEAREPFQRAHVMPFLYAHPERFRLLSVRGAEDHSHHRWTVDTAEDLAVVSAIYAALGGADAFSWRDALRVVAENPALELANVGVTQKPLHQG